MQKVAEVLRLCWGAKAPLRAAAKALGVGKTTVSACLKRAEAAGLSWPLPAQLDAAGLVRLLYPQEVATGPGRRGPPDWADIHRQLRGKGMTLFLLWQEYRERDLAGYGYSRLRELYAQWRGQVDVVMRQSHRAGEKLFVDYAGQTVDIVDPTTGEVQAAQIFIAVLGASNYTFAEATRTQGLPIGSARMCAPWPSSRGSRRISAGTPTPTAPMVHLPVSSHRTTAFATFGPGRRVAIPAPQLSCGACFEAAVSC